MKRYTQNLIDAKKLIADKDNWCQYELKNDQGQYCAIGALSVGLYRPRTRTLAYRKLRSASMELHQMGVSGVNDVLGHTQVMEIYDHAINSTEVPEGFEGELR